MDLYVSSIQALALIFPCIRKGAFVTLTYQFFKGGGKSC